MSLGLTIYIQAIGVRWDKGQRGGPKAILRNRVSESLKMLPFDSLSQSPSYVKQQATFSSTNGFTVPIKNVVEVTAHEPVKLGGVSLVFTGDALNVYYRWDWNQGAPPRSLRRHDAFSLSFGEWGRVLYNGRLSGESCWWYEKWVYNIGLFQSPPMNVFLKSQPRHVYSQMGHLF